MFNTNLVKIWLIAAMTVWLAACSSSSSDDADGDADTGGGGAVISLADLNGTWTSGCVDTGVASIIVQFLFNNDALTGTVATYGTSDCTGAFTQEITDFMIVLGGVVTLDGSVAGITSATEIDITNVTPGPELGEVEYDIVAIQGSNLYVGDDGVNDGSTPALRPTQVDDFLIFTRV